MAQASTAHSPLSGATVSVATLASDSSVGGSIQSTCACWPRARQASSATGTAPDHQPEQRRQPTRRQAEPPDPARDGPPRPGGAHSQTTSTGSSSTA